MVQKDILQARPPQPSPPLPDGGRAMGEGTGVRFRRARSGWPQIQKGDPWAALHRSRPDRPAYFDAVLLPARRSSSSITVVMLSSGTAPLMNRPLMNIAGVPLTPAAEPALMSAWMAVAFSPESRHLLNLSAFRPTEAALALRWSTPSSSWLPNIASCSSQNLP